MLLFNQMVLWNLSRCSFALVYFVLAVNQLNEVS